MQYQERKSNYWYWQRNSSLLVSIAVQSFLCIMFYNTQIQWQQRSFVLRKVFVQVSVSRRQAIGELGDKRSAHLPVRVTWMTQSQDSQEQLLLNLRPRQSYKPCANFSASDFPFDNSLRIRDNCNTFFTFSFITHILPYTCHLL